MIWGYFGPETFLPLTSAIAGVVGVLLMFGRSSIRLVTGSCRRVLGAMGLGSKAKPGAVPNRPHLKFTSESRGETESAAAPGGRA